MRVDHRNNPVILFKELSANKEYIFDAKLVNTEVNYESTSVQRTADTDPTLDKYNNGDFTFNTLTLTKTVR